MQHSDLKGISPSLFPHPPNTLATDTPHTHTHMCVCVHIYIYIYIYIYKWASQWVKSLRAKAGDQSGRSPVGGHGNPLQYSCPENSLGREPWQATVHGVTKSRTQLKRLSTHAYIKYYYYTEVLSTIQPHISIYLLSNLVMDSAWINSPVCSTMRPVVSSPKDSVLSMSRVHF